MEDQKVVELLEALTRQTIPNDMGLARCRASPASNQSAVQHPIPCLPLPAYHALAAITLMPGGEAMTAPSLDLGVLNDAEAGPQRWLEKAGYGGKGGCLPRGLGLVGWGRKGCMVRGLATTPMYWISGVAGVCPANRNEVS